MIRSLPAALAVLCPAAALAGGTIAGTVRADPRLPAPPAIRITKDAAVCGAEAKGESLVMTADGGVANVVVSIQGRRPGVPPAPTAGAGVDQARCRYVPHVQAVTVGTTLSVVNADAVLHNVHGTRWLDGAHVTVFNVAMPLKGQRLPVLLDRPGTLKLRCDAGHPWMSAYVRVFDHPYFAVTDAAGRFAIRDVPAGEHTLEYWHEPFGDQQAPLTATVTVHVRDGKATTSDWTLSPAPRSADFASGDPKR